MPVDNNIFSVVMKKYACELLYYRRYENMPGVTNMGDEHAGDEHAGDNDEHAGDNDEHAGDNYEC
jgi:hypothetical protein